MKIHKKNLRILINNLLIEESSIVNKIGGYITELMTPESIKKAQAKSEKTAENLYPYEHYTRKKAYRHMYGCALLTISLGPDIARFAGYLNELKGAIRVTIKSMGSSFQSGIDMDLPNNELGIDIGIKAIEKFKSDLNNTSVFENKSDNYISEIIKEEVDKGKFWYTESKSGKTLLYSDSSGFMTSAQAKVKYDERKAKKTDKA